MQTKLASFVGWARELAEIEQRIGEKLVTGGYVTITGQASLASKNTILYNTVTSRSSNFEDTGLQITHKTLTENQKTRRTCNLTQLAWQNADTRKQAIERLRIALPLLQIHTELGTAFLEAFDWVDDFLRNC